MTDLPEQQQQTSTRTTSPRAAAVAAKKALAQQHKPQPRQIKPRSHKKAPRKFQGKAPAEPSKSTYYQQKVHVVGDTVFVIKPGNLLPEKVRKATVLESRRDEKASQDANHVLLEYHVKYEPSNRKVWAKAWRLYSQKDFNWLYQMKDIAKMKRVRKVVNRQHPNLYIRERGWFVLVDNGNCYESCYEAMDAADVITIATKGGSTKAEDLNFPDDWILCETEAPRRKGSDLGGVSETQPADLTASGGVPAGVLDTATSLQNALPREDCSPSVGRPVATDHDRAMLGADSRPVPKKRPAADAFSQPHASKMPRQEPQLATRPQNKEAATTQKDPLPARMPPDDNSCDLTNLCMAQEQLNQLLSQSKNWAYVECNATGFLKELLDFRRAKTRNLSRVPPQFQEREDLSLLFTAYMAALERCDPLVPQLAPRS